MKELLGLATDFGLKWGYTRKDLLKAISQCAEYCERRSNVVVGEDDDLKTLLSEKGATPQELEDSLFIEKSERAISTLLKENNVLAEAATEIRKGRLVSRIEEKPWFEWKG